MVLENRVQLWSQEYDKAVPSFYGPVSKSDWMITICTYIPAKSLRGWFKNKGLERLKSSQDCVSNDMTQVFVFYQSLNNIYVPGLPLGFYIIVVYLFGAFNRAQYGIKLYCVTPSRIQHCIIMLLGNIFELLLCSRHCEWEVLILRSVI